MADAQDPDEAARSSAGRLLAAARWGTTVVDKAVATVIARSAELDNDTRAAIVAAVSEEASGGR
jgi:hypothetical protein